MDRYINTPLDNKTAKTLKAGDYVYITGTIYTARDAAHKRMDETLNRNESLPIDVRRVLQQPREWTNTHQGFLIWDL